MSLILRMPWPDPVLWPNRAAGKHWTAKHKAKCAARDAGFYAAKQAKTTQVTPELPDGDIPLSLVFCASSARRFDLDGALSACKPALDGIAQALGVDDSRFCPVVLNRGNLVKGGAVIVGIGVEAA